MADASGPPAGEQSFADRVSGRIKARVDQRDGWQCPICKARFMAVVDQYVNLALSPEPGQIVIGGKTVPCAATVCMSCGFVAHHALAVLGLLPQQEGR